MNNKPLFSPLFQPSLELVFKLNQLSSNTTKHQHTSTTTTMAVTHADLAPRPKSTELGSKTGAFLMVLSIICGLFCFILCLMAEATRSEVTWVSTSSKGKVEKYQCVYSGSGKAPLLSGAGAFLLLAIGMVVEHTYMLVAVSKSPPPALVTWEPDSTNSFKSLTWQAGFFFIATWVCFAVGEILLLIGLSVESGHLTKWSTPRQSCLIIRQGLFTAAGIFGLITVFLATGLYLTALRAQRLYQDHENVRREVIEASVLYASPPRSPRLSMMAIAPENPIIGQNLHERSLFYYLSNFDKHSNMV